MRIVLKITDRYKKRVKLLLARTVSRWKVSINNDFRRLNSSVWPHLGPLNIKQGLTLVPILSVLKSCKPLYSLMPNSTISNSSCSNKRPSTKFPGRFFELEPNINREHSFFSTKLENKTKWQSFKLILLLLF